MTNAQASAKPVVSDAVWPPLPMGKAGGRGCWHNGLMLYAKSLTPTLSPREREKSELFGIWYVQDKSRGMTLVEILIALAIASLMTLTGWRAVDALQSSRDRMVKEAAQWQRLDDFFVTLEADLRRASITEFAGTGDTITVLQPALDGGIDVQTIGYRLAPSAAPTAANAFPGIDVVRESGSERTPMAEVQSLNVTYSMDGSTFEPSTNVYPRALRITMLPVGATAPVERLFALR